jgi:hypothetical protein
MTINTVSKQQVETWWNTTILEGHKMEDGSVVWREKGLLHRSRGPAVIRPDGTREYWIRGVRVK